MARSQTRTPADPGGDPPAPSVHNASLTDVDPEIAGAILAEVDRQRDTLDMIASENIAPLAVLQAQGSPLTNKYADGYPGHRDYDGCEIVDEIERIAISRACELFGADHANVQPYSGSSANAAVLHALCKPDDTILGFDFNHGGHPTHYAPETFAGRYYRAVPYHADPETGLVDMGEVALLAERHKPKVIFAGWSCYPRWLDFARFREIADSVDAALVVDMAHFAGLVAAKVHPDPVPFADALTMTIHKTLGGARGGAILCKESLAARIDAAVYPGEQGCPLMHVIAGKAVTFRVAATEEYRERMRRTVEGARIIADAIVALEGETGVGVLTGGTDVHQVLLNMRATPFDAAGGLERLHAVGINANDIRIPYDRREAPAASGIRLGTAALATRGFGPDEFADLGALLAVVFSSSFESRRKVLAARALELVRRFPIYPLTDDA